MSFGDQIHLSHEPRRSLTRTANALSTQLDLNPRAAIDLPIAVKDAMNLSGSFAIFSRVRTGFPFVPIVIATHRDAKDPAHRAHGIKRCMLCNKWIR